MGGEILYSYKESKSKRYLTVGEMKSALSEIEDDNMLFLVSDGERFFIVDEIEKDEEDDLVVRAITEF